MTENRPTGPGEIIFALNQRIALLKDAARLLEKRRTFMLPGTFDQAMAEIEQERNTNDQRPT